MINVHCVVYNTKRRGLLIERRLPNLSHRHLLMKTPIPHTAMDCTALVRWTQPLAHDKGRKDVVAYALEALCKQKSFTTPVSFAIANGCYLN